MVLAVTEAGRNCKQRSTGKIHRAVAWILTKRDAEEAQRLLREYLEHAPIRNGYPRPAMAHYWLGQNFENQGNAKAARGEYETAVKLDPKNKLAQEALKNVKKG